MPSTFEPRRRRMSSFIWITVAFILSSFLFASKIGTSSYLNVVGDDAVPEQKRINVHPPFFMRGGIRISKTFHSGDHVNYLDYNHRNMQSNRRCIDVTISLDQYPADTSWIIIDDSNGDIMATSPAYDVTMALTKQSESVCLKAPGIYSFVISDDYEDGLCCLWGEGSYTVTTSSSVNDDSVEVLASGGAWNGPNETTTFAITEIEAPPTNKPTNIPTNIPTPQPSIYSTAVMESAETNNITTQVNIYLTGVPNNQNMTSEDQMVFETLFYTMLQSRLETVDVDIQEVFVDTQINDPEFDADSPFESQSSAAVSDGEGGVELSVLQLVANITLTYSDPPPEGWRDWSIYLTSWVESFGTTMVDIFTDPKHELYPDQKFFSSISDVSATNVVPPNTDPTLSPTISPTYLGPPEYKEPLVTGLASAGVVAVVLFFVGAVWYKKRRLKMTRTHNINISEEWKQKEEEEEEESLDREDSDEDNSSSQDGMLEPSPSTAFQTVKGDEHDGNDDDEGNIRASPIIQEEKKPVLGAVALMPNESLNDLSQYDKVCAAVMSNDPNLMEVVLDNERIGFDEGERLWQALTTNKYVKLLSLQNSNISDDQIAALALALNENTSISRLSLQNNTFTAEGVEYLIICLECNTTLKVVDLGDLPIDARIFNELNAILQSRGGHANGVSTIEFILEQIRENYPNLTDLNLSGMDIGPRVSNEIMNALAGNSFLRRVDLSSNIIDDDCVGALSLALTENTSVTHLSLADNRITSIGAEYLLCALDSNDAIRHVDLAGNSIDDGLFVELNHVLKQRRMS